jgi:hypothetical protein
MRKTFGRNSNDLPNLPRRDHGRPAVPDLRGPGAPQGEGGGMWSTARSARGEIKTNGEPPGRNVVASMKKKPFKDNLAEADAISKMLKDPAKRIKNYNPARLAVFVADASKACIHLRLAVHHELAQ